MHANFTQIAFSVEQEGPRAKQGHEVKQVRQGYTVTRSLPKVTGTGNFSVWPTVCSSLLIRRY